MKQAYAVCYAFFFLSVSEPVSESRKNPWPGESGVAQAEHHVGYDELHLRAGCQTPRSKTSCRPSAWRPSPCGVRSIQFIVSILSIGQIVSVINGRLGAGDNV